MKTTLLPLLLTASLVTPTLHAQSLQGPIDQLSGFLGTWEVEATWSHGMKLWSRAQYAPGVAGRSLEGRVLVKDGDGPAYPRYLSIFRWDSAAGAVRGHTISFDGSGRDADMRFEDGALISEWSERGATFRDRSELVGDGEIHWTVTVQPPGDIPMQTLLDATWKRVGQPGAAAPIDSNLFAPDAQPDSFSLAADIASPLDAVWAAWTDGEAFAAAVAPEDEQLVAHIDLRVGGRYEILWDGAVGSNGCQVLSYVPEKMLSFSWNAPTDQVDSRAQRSFVVLLFSENDEGNTHVELHHEGFGARANWSTTKTYFEQAWPMVLTAMGTNLEAAQQG